MNFFSAFIYIDWKKGVNDNKSKLEQLSNRYIFLLCIYLVKRTKRIRDKQDGWLNFQQYLNFYYKSKLLNSTLKEEEPYKTILEQKDSENISNEAKVQLLKEYEKYVNTNYSTLKCIYQTILVTCLVLFFILLIAFVAVLPFFIKNQTLKHFPFVLVVFLFVLPSISIIEFRNLQVLKNPSKSINTFFNITVGDLKCIRTLEYLYEKITEITIINNEQESFAENNEKLLDSKKVIYSDLTKEELVKEFKKEYPKIFEKYPTFLEILQKHPYGNKKDVLLDENFKIKISTNRKMILCFIDKNKTKSHKLDLIQALFKPDYSNLSNEMTSEYPKNKIKEFEKFLEQESKKIF